MIPLCHQEKLQGCHNFFKTPWPKYPCHLASFFICIKAYCNHSYILLNFCQVFLIQMFLDFRERFFLNLKHAALHNIILFHKKWKSYSLKAQAPFQIYDSFRIFHPTRCTHHENILDIYLTCLWNLVTRLTLGGVHSFSGPEWAVCLCFLFWHSFLCQIVLLPTHKH